jgi:tRNA1Val (adenine37-N6)-methyltransferase
MDFLPASDETLDLFFNGALQVLQKKRGYRFSIDAVLLSQFIRLRGDEKGIDLGTGCGILPLLLSRTTKAHSIMGIEIQESLAELAEKNIAINHLEDRITILHQDFKKLKKVFSAGSFDVVFSNPPYRKVLTGRINPSLEKAVARHEIQGTLNDLIETAAYLLPTKGRCYLIYSAPRTVDLLVTLRRNKLEPKRLRFIHPKREENAKFILVESVKSSGTDLKVMEPWILDRFSILLFPERENDG